MKKLLIGLSLLALAAFGLAQDHHGSHGGGGGHAMSHSGGGHGSGHGSFGGRSGGARPSGGFSHGSGRSHGGGSSFGTHGSFGHNGRARVGMRSGGHGGHFRPSGTSHNYAWFTGRGGWHHGPAYIHPRFSIGIGYQWGVIPTNRVLVWMQDPATGQYYQAYYYPDYGYYAWYNRPLVAVGIYTPSLAIVIR